MQSKVLSYYYCVLFVSSPQTTLEKEGRADRERWKDLSPTCFLCSEQTMGSNISRLFSSALSFTRQLTRYFWASNEFKESKIFKQQAETNRLKGHRIPQSALDRAYDLYIWFVNSVYKWFVKCLEIYT